MTPAVLDISVAIPLIHGRDNALAQFAASYDLIIPAIVLGELCHGASRSDRPDLQNRLIDGLVTQTPVMPCDHETAQVYGRITAQLRKVGKPIPTNDAWIAACCIQHGLPLFTRDRHFDKVLDLAIVSQP